MYPLLPCHCALLNTFGCEALSTQTCVPKKGSSLWLFRLSKTTRLFMGLFYPRQGGFPPHFIGPTICCGQSCRLLPLSRHGYCPLLLRLLSCTPFGTPCWHSLNVISHIPSPLLVRPASCICSSTFKCIGKAFIFRILLHLLCHTAFLPQTHNALTQSHVIFTQFLIYAFFKENICKTRISYISIEQFYIDRKLQRFLSCE